MLLLLKDEEKILEKYEILGETKPLLIKLKLNEFFPPKSGITASTCLSWIPLEKETHIHINQKQNNNTNTQEAKIKFTPNLQSTIFSYFSQEYFEKFSIIKKNLHNEFQSYISSLINTKKSEAKSISKIQTNLDQTLIKNQSALDNFLCQDIGILKEI